MRLQQVNAVDPGRTGEADKWGATIAEIAEIDGTIVASLHDPKDRSGPIRLELGSAEQASELTARHRMAVGESVTRSSSIDLAEATDELLAGVYELVSSPLLPLLDPYPRVGLDLGGEALRSLPIETAHRPGEPALFEMTQLFRTAEQVRPSRAARRFRLALHPGAVSDLDVIALEQSLIQWVSGPPGRLPTADADREGRSGRRDLGGRTEPLLHVAGHDPAIPEGLLKPDDRAHVVLSGCSSLPDRLPPGVSSVVGSLWPVDDNTNSSIMAAYHARLAAGIGPVEALRQAQFLHRHLAPVAWASYVHVGQPT